MALIDNILAYYKLDDVNDSVASYALTNNNSVAFNAGKIGNGGDLGASNSTKSLNRDDSYGLNRLSLRSMSFWFKLATAPSSGNTQILTRFLFATNTGNYTDVAYRNNAGTYEMVINTSPATFTVAQTLTVGTWYHLVITHDGTGTTNAIKLYLDTVNILNGNSWDTSNFSALTTRLAIGVDHALASQHASGIFDEYGLWNKILSTDEIAELYNSGSGLQYPFVAGTSIKDIIGGGFIIFPR